MRRSKPAAVAAALALGAVGLILVVHVWPRFREGMERRHWRTTEGKVVDSQVTTTPDLLPVVVYEYEVAGRRYQDTSRLQAPGFGTRRARYEVAIKSIVPYPPGASVAVWYDPDDPAHSTLVPHPEWRVFVQLGTGLLLVLIALWWLMLIWRSGRRRAVESGR